MVAMTTRRINITATSADTVVAAVAADLDFESNDKSWSPADHDTTLLWMSDVVTRYLAEAVDQTVGDFALMC